MMPKPDQARFVCRRRFRLVRRVWVAPPGFAMTDNLYPGDTLSIGWPICQNGSSGACDCANPECPLNLPETVLKILIQQGRRSRMMRVWQAELDGLPGIARLSQDSHNLLYSTYNHAQNLCMAFAEAVIELPEMKKFRVTNLKATDEYMPGWPPMSPVSLSFFTTWLACDLELGQRSRTGAETMGQCFEKAWDYLGLPPEGLQVQKNFHRSRPYICEHLGLVGQKVRLRELLSDREFLCHIGSGYLGKTQDLMFMRICPPLVEGPDAYHVTMSSPYILDSSRDDWLQYLQRAIGHGRANKGPATLDALMKFGLKPTHWLDFIMDGYHGHLSNAIFLMGIPDIKGSLPHAS